MSEVTDKLLAIRQKSLPPQEPVVEAAPETPPVQQPVVENKVITEVKVTEPPVVEQTPAPETSWDDTPEVKAVTPQFDISSLVSDLEIGEIKSKDDLKTWVTQTKSKLKEYEEKPLAGLPDEFKEVIEVAKTGDWKDYLASQLIDYSKLDPIEEFENDYIRRAQANPKFFTDGKYDHAKVEQALDDMPEATRELYGQQMLQAKAHQQAQYRAGVEAKAKAREAEAESNLISATKNLQEILPLEKYAIKFEPKHSTEIYNGIANSSLTKKHLGASYHDLVRMGADMKAVVRTITLAEKGEKMIAYKAANSKTEVKKEILANTQNVQLNSSSSHLNPDNPETKVVTPVDKLKEHFTSQKKGL
jgi:hypothetical protein